MTLSREAIEDALRRVGERLYAAGYPASLVIAGGAALSLLGVIERATSDVDVIAWRDFGPGAELCPPPNPLPLILRRAVEAVGVELGLDPNWFDLRVAEEWKYGLPVGFGDRVHWRTFGGALSIGVAARPDLIYLKLVAAADGIHPRHLQDLLRLAPTDAELDHAVHEARRTNVGLDPDLDRVIARCREDRHA
jgi:hypothetical protein